MYLGNAETAEGDGYLISWKNYSQSRFDTDRLKKERPEIYSGFLKSIQSRRFSVKKAG